MLFQIDKYLQRELVLCSHDILASRRDSVAFSVLVRSSFLPPDVSSESVTTSLKGHTDDNKSCSETMQRSDDITEDSTVSGTCRLTLPMHMGIDGKPDDSSTSKRPCTRKPTYRLHLSGKQLPHRPAPIASQNIANNRDKRSKSKKVNHPFFSSLLKKRLFCNKFKENELHMVIGFAVHRDLSERGCNDIRPSIGAESAVT